MTSLVIVVLFCFSLAFHSARLKFTVSQIGVFCFSFSFSMKFNSMISFIFKLLHSLSISVSFLKNHLSAGVLILHSKMCATVSLR